MRKKITLGIGMLLLAVSACTTAPGPDPTPSATASVPVSLPTQVFTAVSTPSPLPPDLPPFPSPDLIHVYFEDPSFGWGVAGNAAGAILRTVDGGLTWLNATPPGASGLGYSTAFYALDAQTAWALVPNLDFFTGILYHTSDGGLAWTYSDVPFGGGKIQFLDPEHGFVLADRGAAAGSNAVELYRTSNGGGTWTSVFSDDPNLPGSTDTLPLSGIKNGLLFLDETSGWVTGSRPENGDIYLFATHDGGISWAQQALPLPPDGLSSLYMVQAPVFFGQAGYLPVTIYSADSVSLAFFVTHDGGITWSGGSSDAQGLLPGSGFYSFTDASNAFVWNGGPDLFATNAGTAHWIRITPNIDLSGRLAQLQFVGAASGKSIGFALTRIDDAGHSRLYRSGDGGLTWVPIVP